MLRRIFALRQILVWNLAVLLLLVVSAGFVARQHEKARKQCVAKCVDFDSCHGAPADHVESCQECEANADWHLPGWYRAFGWPDGVTAWALILTLIVIAAQTRVAAIPTEATRKAADAALDSAKAANAQIQMMKDKERARLRLELRPFDPKDGASVGYLVRGDVFITGSTQANVESTYLIASICRGKINDEVYRAPMSIPRVMEANIIPIEVVTPLLRGAALVHRESDDIRDVLRNESDVYCFGCIRYGDLFGQMWEYRISKKFVFRSYGIPLADGSDLASGWWADHGAKDANGEHRVHRE